MQVCVGKLALWFSYDTVVAFQLDGHSRQVRQNSWSTTTGKHLNAIDDGDKKNRLASDVFEANLHDVLKQCNLAL
jgi:hypothetical protein